MKCTYFLGALLALLMLTSCEKETPIVEDLNVQADQITVQHESEYLEDGKTTDVSKIENWGRIDENGELVKVSPPNPNSRAVDNFLTIDWSAHPSTTWELYYKDATGFTSGIGPTSGTWAIFLPLPNQVYCPNSHIKSDYKLYIFNGPECQLVKIGFNTSSCGNIDTDFMYFEKGPGHANYFKADRYAWSCSGNESAVSYRSCNGNGTDCD